MTENQAEYKGTDKRLVETKDVAVQGTSPAAVIQLAMTTGVDLDKLEKLLAIQEKWEANEAKKAYHDAMSRFKANPPEIEKDKKVGYQPKDDTKPFVGYSHASLANVTGKINRALSEHGLSAGWTTTQESGSISVKCTITHRLGHSENTALSASPDTSGSKNAIQAIGSTISYLERYTILALTGLATHDMDDDGKGSEGEPEYLTADQQIEINDKIKVLYPKTPGKFLKWFGCESVEKIPAKEYGRAIGALKNIALEAKSKKAERTPGEEG